MKNPKAVKIFALVLAFILALITEQYSERLWVLVPTPSGNREIYHGAESYLLAVLIFGVVALLTYKLTVRIILKKRN